MTEQHQVKTSAFDKLVRDFDLISNGQDMAESLQPGLELTTSGEQIMDAEYEEHDCYPRDDDASS
nr:hypothetical protein [uncultured Hyphomonas sp.]